MKFTQRSVLYCSTLHFDEISKFLGISAQEIFMKVLVSSILKSEERK